MLITTDQQHYDALGVRDAKLKTPNLDRLCMQGTRFDRAYCPSPVCTPSRASIITGQYPSHHGAWTIGVKLPEDVPTVGDHLIAAGYSTALIGKAHFQPLASKPGSESLECQPVLRDLDFWRGSIKLGTGSSIWNLPAITPMKAMRDSITRSGWRTRGLSIGGIISSRCPVKTR
nr:sulfatase-like hydrolase/transferase [Marinicella sp. W31]MDC2875429.1 sulfatase-like hydrolase/transferase [Marinicella sp. W31]